MTIKSYTPIVLCLLVCCVSVLFSSALVLADDKKDDEKKETAEEHHDPLHNLIEVAPGYYSGGEPAGEEAFRKLKEMGVKYVVSVDGIRPDIELARKYGIRYVHIPIQYSGIDRDAQLKLVRAAEEIDEPVYVHCHHGKHRGPASMAIMCRAAGLFDAQRADQYLHDAGTSPEYKGLWKDVREFKQPDAGTVLPQLQEVAEVDSVAGHMAEADRIYDHLAALLEEEQTLTSEVQEELNGDLLLLWELIRESRRAVALDQDSAEELVTAFEKSDRRLNEIREELKKVDSRDRWLEHLQQIKKDCRDCHGRFRN